MNHITIQRINSHNWQDHQQDLEKFCLDSEQDPGSPASVNYHWTSWQDNPASLMYLLATERRYDTGFFDLLYRDQELVAVSGCYAADWNPRVLIIGSRAYTKKSLRGHEWFHGDYLFPRQWQHAEQHFRAAVITTNDYNNRLLRFIELASTGRTTHQPIPDFYRHFHVMPAHYSIKFTAQRIAVRLTSNTTWEEFYQSLCPPLAA